MSNLTIRPVTEEEYPAFVSAFMEGFSEDLPSKNFPEIIRETLPPERTLAAFDGDAIVGTFGGYDLLLTVPGGTVKMEGTTVVTVYPTHRRMGLANAMMSDHLENAAANGYPVAGLWASASDIYPRHGYGIATYSAARKMKGRDVRLREGIRVDRVRRIAREGSAEILSPVYDTVCAETPGMFARDQAWWSNEVLTDEDWMKRGRTSMRIVVHDGPEGVDGYAIYRQKSDESDDGHANGIVSVVELIAGSGTAKASLWTYVTNIDGCPNVKFWNHRIDDNILTMVREPRRVQTTAVFDALWIRLLDVESALSSRTYDEDGTLVFGVVDSYRPGTEGTYRMDVENGIGVCRRSDEKPTLDLDVDVLGAMYLGGADGIAYHAAGRIRGSETDILAMHRIFRTINKPWCNQVF